MESRSQCRGCLAPETHQKKHVSIFENDLQQAYNDLTQSQLLADSPYNNLCVMCSKLLQSFSEFRLQCMEANAYFVELEAKELVGEVDETLEKEQKEEEAVVSEEMKDEVVPCVEVIEMEEETPKEIPETKVDEIVLVSTKKTIKDTKLKEKIKTKVARKRKRKKFHDEDELQDIPFKKSVTSDEIPLFVCEICPQKVFTNVQHYREHQKIHQEGRFECHFCGIKYRSKFFLLGHVDRNHLEKDFGKRGEFACNLCPKRYLTEFRLKKHLGIHKLSKKPCPVCGELVKNLCSHMTKHNTTERFQCEKCDKSYKSRQHLEIHAIVHENKLFSCDICGREFNRPDKVTSHKKVHDPNRPTFECPECHKKFTFKTALTGHMRTHSGERPFECLVCGMSFALSGNLSKHMHSHTGTKPYMCKFCNYGTKKKTEFEFHLRMNHEYEDLERVNPETMLVDYLL